MPRETGPGPGLRRHPHLYEANARILLRRLSDRHGRELTLASVPEEEWRRLAERGFDLLWLMGVWRRSEGARREALAHAGLRTAYAEVLGEWTEDDVAGSPYAIREYAPDSPLGSAGDLRALRATLHRLGIGLILDFVPNHLALDHPWVLAHPGRFVRATEAAAREHPEWFFSPDGKTRLAHGRDPNFPPWTDTAQVNFFSDDMRRALVGELHRIAAVADGVRCDMAMLALDDVFRGVWGGLLPEGPRRSSEFWSEAIERVRERSPGFLFLGEAYWGLEGRLLDLGFDFVYDKTFYDRLRFDGAESVRAHLLDPGIDHARTAKFIENHDEPRAVEAFGRDRSLAAAVVLATVPGMRLFHDGQLEGRRIRLPVQLVREPEEEADPAVATAYERLLGIGDERDGHEGAWEAIDPRPAADDDGTHRHLLSWSWRRAERRFRVVVVNYAGRRSRGRLRLDAAAGGGEVELRERWTDVVTTRAADELAGPGLLLELEPWQVHVFEVGPR